MYDYTFLEVRVHRVGCGYPGGQYVGTCKVCGRKWICTSMDDFHGKDNMKHMYRRHVKPHTNEECTAGMVYYSVEYMKRIERERQRQ